jgi:RNA polymerase sigma-70 factor (ECF subfamily)
MAEEECPERAAFERLYEEQGSPVRSFLRLAMGNSSVADDLTQETFLQLWRRRGAIDPGRGGAKAYLLGIARKKAADWWRRNKARAAVGSEAAIASSDGLAIRDAMNQLPEESREVLWLREVEGYSYEELAEILKIPIGTVRSRLHAARRQLRSVWMKEGR